jgi:chromosome segregation ATPase
MLFNPTPMERLTTLTTELVSKHATVSEELKTLKEEIAASRANTQSKEDELELFTAELSDKEREIERLRAELSAKDAEIEAIVVKIESLLA